MHRILKTTVLSLICMSALSIPAFAAVIGGGTVDVDDTSYLNLRSEASTESAVLAKAPNGAYVAVEEEYDGWYKVLYNGISGYMSADYIEFSENISGELGTGIINGTSVRLRQSAGYSSSVVGYVNTGDKVTVTGMSGEWYAVSVNGSSGYVHSDYVVLNGSAQDTSADTGDTSMGELIVETAEKYLGCPYVWGGNSPSGFDCSGFVKYVFAECGYTLKRTAADIATEGTWVAKEDIQPGDILCFNDGGTYIGHVGIYIGNNEFIHASTSSTGVIISDLDTDWYETRYSCARRCY